MVDIKTLWKSQKPEDTVTLDDIRQRATKFQRRVRNRNLREYVAAAVVVVWFGWYIWALPGLLVKIGSALCIAGVLFIVWQLHRRAASQVLPREVGSTGYLDFHRKALARQRDALRTVWRWYLAPLVPGMAVMLAGVYFNAPPAMRAVVLHSILAWYLPCAVLVFGAIWWLNMWGAKRLQKRIDEIDRLQSNRGNE
jgi:Flp pilus assembly protein TadB